MSGYRLLLELTVEHAYFVERGCPDLKWQPSSDTAVLIQQAGLLIKETAAGFTIWMPSGHPFDLPAHIDEGGKDTLLTWYGVPRSARFAEITVPAIPPGSVIMLDSRAALDADPQTGVCMLHPGAWVGADALAPLPSQPAGARNAGQPGLLLRFALNTLCGERAGDAGPQPAKRFKLCLDTVRTHWKYYLMGQLTERTLHIADLDGAVAFRQLDRADLTPGRSAAVFLSEQPIALAERPGQRLQLKEVASFGERTLIKRMPVARPGGRQRDVVDGQAVLVSEIFINQ